MGGIGATEIAAPTLLCECHADVATTWDRTTLVTTHLHEWYPETGLKPDRDTDEHGAMRFAWTWERPESRSIEIALLTSANTGGSATSVKPIRSSLGKERG